MSTREGAKKSRFSAVLQPVLAFLMVMVMMTIFGCGRTETPDNPSKDPSDDGQKEVLSFDWDTDLTVSGRTKTQSTNMLTATDDFGRTFNPISGKKTDKDRYVGLFYFLWMGQHGGQQGGIYDVSKLLEEGDDALWGNSSNSSSTSPVGQYHFWGEPLYGYYNSADPWVIRKQIELLTMSGVDFLVLDATNAFTYFEVLDVMLPIMQEYYDAGWNVPKIVFYTNSSSDAVVKRLYQGFDTPDANKSDLYNKGIYKNGYFKDLWFMPNGKPLIIGITENNNGASDQRGIAITDPTLLNFFEIKESQWPNTGITNENGWPWVEFGRPQSDAYNDVVSVSVGQHNKLPFSDAALSATLSEMMYGRGYTSANGADHSDEAINAGLNIEEQWGVAKEYDKKYTFLTGWNEWIALKQYGAPGNGSYLPDGNQNRAFFVDTFNEEYSRDIEMMKGGYSDNFYLQMTRNIRDYKSVMQTTAVYSDYAAIDVAKGLEQWNSVSDVYFDFTGEAIERNSAGFCDSVTYTDKSNRNDIDEVRVANDGENVYFLVKCADDIVVQKDGGNWMNLLIDIPGNTDNSWYGYNYIVNRSVGSKGATSVESFRVDGSKVSYVSSGSAEIRVSGKYAQYKIPKSALGISGENFRIDFKVCDNVADMPNVESFYITGDVCPGGRVNYVYCGK